MDRYWLSAPTLGAIRGRSASTWVSPWLRRGHFSRDLRPARTWIFLRRWMTVPRRIRVEKVEVTLESVGLAEAADTLVMKFSSGMYQRLGIARALIKGPSVILLDEPTRSIDPGSAAHCWNLVRELPKQRSTVLLATHSFQEAVAVADYVAILSRGTVVSFRHISDSTSVEDLRSCYFQATGETGEMASPVGRE
jgi:ABC-type multidrug transport system ATPase subunit